MGVQVWSTNCICNGKFIDGLALKIYIYEQKIKNALTTQIIKFLFIL